MRAHTQHVENHKPDAHRDRGIGDVERPEMVAPPIDVDEIDDGPDDHAVDEVSGGAAQDHSGSVDDAIASEALAMGAEAFLHKASETQLLRAAFSRIVEEIQLGSTRSFQVSAQVRTADSAAKDKRMSLSPRELQILELLLQGCTNQEIAEATGLALGTAKNYISGIFSVFGVASRSKLIALFH